MLLLLLAVAVGWVAQQEWRWLPLAPFDRESEEEKPAPEITAGLPASQQPEVEEPAVETAGEQPGAAPRQATTSAETDAAIAPGAAAEGSAGTPAATPESGAAPGASGAEQASGTESTAAAPAGPEVGASRAPSAADEPSGAGPTATAGQNPPPADVAAIEPSAPSGEAASGAPSRQAPAHQEPRAAAPSDEEGGQATAAPGAGEPSPDETVVRPSFDIVRVERDGRAVIAGRAPPGAEVEVRSGGQVIDTVRASRRGEWVAIPAMPLPAGDQMLSAVATQEGAKPVESDQVVVVAVPPSAPTAATVKAEAERGTPAQQPVAVLLPRDGTGTGRVLQAPGRLSADGTLALMQVSYDEAGKVLLSGEAPPGVPVRVYVDNRPAALVVGDAKGAWQAGLDESLAPGTYTLRLDQLGADGRTVARIETPFTRVGDPPVEGNLKVDYVVVQPGNSLWRIARRLSGRGLNYLDIYAANDAQIRDPDLIYPGQVFEIPEKFGAAH